MPGMGGRDLARRLRATQPDLRVLFISGYAEEGNGGGDPQLAGTAFLAKPFSPADLLVRVDTLLGAAEGP